MYRQRGEAWPYTMKHRSGEGGELNRIGGGRHGSVRAFKWTIADRLEDASLAIIVGFRIDAVLRAPIFNRKATVAAVHDHLGPFSSIHLFSYFL